MTRACSRCSWVRFALRLPPRGAKCFSVNPSPHLRISFFFGREGAAFPKNFVSAVKVIFKRLFRIYGHIYHKHFQRVVDMGAEAHLNTCFKHFIYFIKEFNLVDDKELAPLQDLIEARLKEDEQK